MRGPVVRIRILIASLLSLPAFGVDPDRDFTGDWALDASRSRTAELGKTETSLRISHSNAGILCSVGTAKWSYTLDGSETRKRVGEETRSSIAKWEGAALLINTLVSGPSDYTVMDRWRLSRDRNSLTITRQIVRGRSQLEGVLVFSREGTPVTVTEQHVESIPSTASPNPTPDGPKPRLSVRPEPAMLPDVTVPVGTRVLLRLINGVDTKRAKEGDRVYLRTSVPVAVGGQVVIPRDSDVQGTVTRTKAAGRVVGKGELFILFDRLTLPNGTSREFHARPSGDEGRVTGDGRSADGRTVMAGTGMGATIGGVASGLPGAAVGGGVGALAGVLLSRNQNVVLRPGTQLEMILDRDLVFHPDELPANPRYR